MHRGGKPAFRGPRSGFFGTRVDAKEAAKATAAAREGKQARRAKAAANAAARSKTAGSRQSPDREGRPAKTSPTGRRPAAPAKRPSQSADVRTPRPGSNSRQRPVVPKPARPRPDKKREAGSPRSRDGEHGGAPAEPMRIAKAIARAGLCSRREAERWIAEGRVSVNGRTLRTPGVQVSPRDRIEVDGSPLPQAEPVRLWRYHKPRGLVTTHRDPEGRPTVFDNLPADLPRVISIGRLDFNTEGLLLLTTDGALARYLELPATGWLRRYRVRARGRIRQADLDALKDGVTIEGVSYGPIEATLDSEHGANIWLTVGLREGKNREIRKIMQYLGLEVGRLIRVSFGPFQLLDLAPGKAEQVRRRTLADQLGPRIGRELGVVTEDDDDPQRETSTTDRRSPSGTRPARGGDKPT